jgi:hypothetical protein
MKQQLLHNHAQFVIYVRATDFKLVEIPTSAHDIRDVSQPNQNDPIGEGSLTGRHWRWLTLGKVRWRSMRNRRRAIPMEERQIRGKRDEE